MSGQRAKEGTIALPFSWNRAKSRSHNLGKALGKGWVYSKTGLSSYTVKFSERRKDLKTEFFCEM